MEKTAKIKQLKAQISDLQDEYKDKSRNLRELQKTLNEKVEVLKNLEEKKEEQKSKFKEPGEDLISDVANGI